MLQNLANLLEHFLTEYGYFAVFVLMFVEEADVPLPLPNEVALMYVGYLSSGRIATGIVLAFMLCLPRVLAEGRQAEAWPLFVLWLMPLYDFFPTVLHR